jgi:hypothetical protein
MSIPVGAVRCTSLSWTVVLVIAAALVLAGATVYFVEQTPSSAGLSPLNPVPRNQPCSNQTAYNDTCSNQTPSNGTPPGWGPPLAPPFNLGSETNSSFAGQYFYNFSVVDEWDNATAGQVGIEVQTLDCKPVSSVTGIEILGAGGTVLAWELNSSKWGGGASAAVNDSDFVSIISNSAFAGDEWVMSWTASETGGLTSGVIAGAAPLEGCGFLADYPQGSIFAGP